MLPPEVDLALSWIAFELGALPLAAVLGLSALPVLVALVLGRPAAALASVLLCTFAVVAMRLPQHVVTVAIVVAYAAAVLAALPAARRRSPVGRAGADLTMFEERLRRLENAEERRLLRRVRSPAEETAGASMEEPAAGPAAPQHGDRPSDQDQVASKAKIGNVDADQQGGGGEQRSRL